jgi:hypothetical protein
MTLGDQLTLLIGYCEVTLWVRAWFWTFNHVRSERLGDYSDCRYDWVSPLEQDVWIWILHVSDDKEGFLKIAQLGRRVDWQCSIMAKWQEPILQMRCPNMHEKNLKVKRIKSIEIICSKLTFACAKRRGGQISRLSYSTRALWRQSPWTAWDNICSMLGQGIHGRLRARWTAR